MGTYRRAFAAHKGERVGDLVTMPDEDARVLVKFGRLKPVEPEPVAAPVKPGKPKGAGGGGDS
ncbi:hypothetical protein SEA_SCHMIDT_13 [Gordonia phage Schmidt]|uniref:Uncharacterized protein n=1 Tax=Gordonia phage Schmidt TaxID=2301697 RepID=A0A385E2N9_9CAUD|nr:hypothetical protein KDJ59_gp13 [Gordonia phage Schmidt]AXQ65135.1 hypothetical protein SEA_SCHMIDT_13 [Gordonia phage Schmidt]